jgi:NADP-dependent aldehyde dehydrogenase
MTDIVSIDPRTAEVVEVVAPEHSTEDVGRACEAAAAAARPLDELGRSGRAAMLRAMADELEAHDAEIVRLADRETGIGTARLEVELKRSAFQLRLFTDVLDDGAYLEATIDHAGETPMGPRPDLRRMLVPIGPVGVFGASNFPLAFSVPGGDTASALAAGCPVVVKAHASHPATSRLCFGLLERIAREAGAPPGTVALVHGLQAGADLVAHPAIQAVGFTGSLEGGTALQEVISARPQPIPFYGEMSSINPVVVTDAAAADRGDEIGAGLVASFTMGAGQLCTKPGVALLPADAAGDQVVTAMSEALTDVPEQVLLNERIRDAYATGTEQLRSMPGVRVLRAPATPADSGYRATAQLIEADADRLGGGIVREQFGPIIVLVRYRDEDELRRALAPLPGSLTATIHSGPGDENLVRELTAILRERAGRLLYDGYPTGVAVAWAQHHGGPWPSTNSLHTSVGPTAIRRFLRPVTWQDAPEHALPAALRDDAGDLPRRVDGRLVPQGTANACMPEEGLEPPTRGS